MVALNPLGIYNVINEQYNVIFINYNLKESL